MYLFFFYKALSLLTRFWLTNHQSSTSPFWVFFWTVLFQLFHKNVSRSDPSEFSRLAVPSFPFVLWLVQQVCEKVLHSPDIECETPTRLKNHSSGKLFQSCEWVTIRWCCWLNTSSPLHHLLTISENPLKQLSAGTGLPSCNYNLSEISAANGGVCRGWNAEGLSKTADCWSTEKGSYYGF